MTAKDGKKFLDQFGRMYFQEENETGVLFWEGCVNYKAGARANHLEFALNKNTLKVQKGATSVRREFQDLTKYYHKSFEYLTTLQDKDRVSIIGWVQHAGDKNTSSGGVHWRRLRIVDKHGIVLTL